MSNMAAEREFIGHDHKVYRVGVVVSGSNYIHILTAPEGTLVGSERVKEITVHVDDIANLIAAMKEVSRA